MRLPRQIYALDFQWLRRSAISSARFRSSRSVEDAQVLRVNA